jgi:hypothetical protein
MPIVLAILIGLLIIAFSGAAILFNYLRHRQVEYDSCCDTADDGPAPAVADDSDARPVSSIPDEHARRRDG